MDCQPYVSNIEPEFRAKVPELQNGPVTFRSSKDSWYILLLFIVLGTFLGLSIYAISEGWPLWNKDSGRYSDQGLLRKDRLSIFVSVVMGMAGLSLLLSVLLLLCWRLCSSGAINITMMGMTISLLVFSLVCFEFKSVAGGIVILVILFVFLIMLCCCFSKHTDTADILVSITSKMLKGASRMIVLPTLIMTIISLALSSLLALSYAGIAQMTYVDQISSTIGYVYYVAIGTTYLLLMFFMYYAMSYLMGVAASYWYIQIEPDSNTIGLKWLFKYNLGTITFASFVILVIKLMQTFVYCIERNWEMKCMRSMRCLTRCLSSSVSGLLHTLNNQGTIVSAYTGESLIGSAKLASVLVYSCYPLFNVVRVIGNFLFFSGIIMCVCCPTWISIIIAHRTPSLQDMSGIVGATVFLTSILTSVVILSATFESLSSLFLMYSLDYRLSTMNVRALACHLETKKGFERLRDKFMPINIPSASSNNFAIY